MTRETLLQLAYRCEAARGADRELDILIKAAVYGGLALQSPFNGEWCVYAPITDDPRTGKLLQRPHSVPHVIWQADNYSASIDAAATLVPEGYVFTVADWWVDGDERAPQFADCASRRLLQNDWDATVSQAWAQTKPLALTAAALRARAEGME